MTTVISGTTGCSQVQAGSINQDDLAANVVGKGPAFSAYQTSAQTLTSTTAKLLMDTEEYDTANCFVNGRYTPNVAGYYVFNGSLSVTGQNTIQLYIYRNGASHKRLGYSNNVQIAGSAEVFLNGTTDYVEVWGSCSSPQAVSAYATDTYFQGFLARAA